MFSGIVEEMGVVKSLVPGLAGARLSILAGTVLKDLQLGESVSVSGACLTAAEVGETDFSVDVSVETLDVTTLGVLTVGAAVNLERALKLNDRLSGHLVTGHVDGTGILRERTQAGNTLLLTMEVPEPVLRYCIPKGSITVDGVSLTINGVSENGVSVAIIPHTAKVTTLGIKQPGDAVNLESDLIGKYVERLLQHSGKLPEKAAPVIDRDYLQKRGLT
ncbi:MAG: riboflavin synthase [Nitrospira sp. SB0677_bin_15]|nr:riboflavin synthase [Nitrospira sp. SB0667_bin_9]MYD31072.1 riboflavin synthase [Nitrospira sp. SB0661_bin_20]MYG39962.1 riboflavin synthase [Nitrospira sp. SB0677_bin_15]MYH02044.1 riboflavin synthase [Nitrospira sp. SB0675_bin_23]MYJ21894.1 riboflavin synthase [Nitrospira sp. SB0673_bin_12]